MKRIFGFTLVLVMLLSVFSLVGCSNEAEPVQVKDINGKAPAVVFEEAVDARKEVKEESGYKVVLDVDFNIHVVVVDIPVGVDGIYEYSYYGDNSHHKLSDSASDVFENKYVKEIIGDSMSDLDKEVWYVDGVYYCVKADGSLERTELEENPISKNVLEDAIDDIVNNHISEAVCYESDGELYFEISVVGEDMYLGDFNEELYRIYFRADGKIDKICVIGKGENYECTVTGTYTYDIPPIEAPKFVITQ